MAVGLTANLRDLGAHAAVLPAALAIVYGARALSVWVSLAALQRLHRIPRRYQALLAWSGLRGGLALALVLTPPPEFPGKTLFLWLATAVVLATLLVNALTTAPLIRRLGVDRLSRLESLFFSRSLARVLDRVFRALDEAASHGSLQADLVNAPMTSRSTCARGHGRACYTSHLLSPHLVIRLETLLHLELGLLTSHPSDELVRFQQGWLAECRRKLQDFHDAYPEIELAVQTRFVADTVPTSARHALGELQRSGAACWARKKSWWTRLRPRAVCTSFSAGRSRWFHPGNACGRAASSGTAPWPSVKSLPRP